MRGRKIFFVYFVGGLEYVCHSFAYVAHLVFLRDVWIRSKQVRCQLSHPSSYFFLHHICNNWDLIAKSKEHRTKQIDSLESPIKLRLNLVPKRKKSVVDNENADVRISSVAKTLFCCEGIIRRRTRLARRTLTGTCTSRSPGRRRTRTVRRKPSKPR
jgi:hypothetical protein